VSDIDSILYPPFIPKITSGVVNTMINIIGELQDIKL